MGLEAEKEELELVPSQGNTGDNLPLSQRRWKVKVVSESMTGHWRKRKEAADEEKGIGGTCFLLCASGFQQDM